MQIYHSVQQVFNNIYCNIYDDQLGYIEFFFLFNILNF